MPVLSSPAKATHRLPDAAFTALATPSRGSSRTSVWRVEIAPGAAGAPHTLTDEEVFVVLDGTANVSLGGSAATASAGDAIVVPPGVLFVLGNDGDRPLRLLCCMPVGGRATLADGSVITPPWSL